jgi:hypothetical protein
MKFGFLKLKSVRDYIHAGLKNEFKNFKIQFKIKNSGVTGQLQKSCEDSGATFLNLEPQVNHRQWNWWGGWARRPPLAPSPWGQV